MSMVADINEELDIPDDLSEDEIKASICQSSFYEFVKEFWGEVIQETPKWNWHIEYICDQIQLRMERVFEELPRLDDLVCNISPGTTKSTVFSVMLPAWGWTRMPSLKFICGSYAYTLAMEMSRKCRDIIKSDKYQAMFPEIMLRDDQDAKELFANTRGGYRYSVGVGGSVMGRHGHVIIVDDPIDPAEALSETVLKSVNHWMSETLPTRKVEKSVTVTMLVMQRLAQDDPSGMRIDKGGQSPVFHICLPAEETEDINPPELREKYINGLMDPVRLSRAVLEDSHAHLGDYGYAGQFLQRPVPRGGGMFQTGNIKYDLTPPMNEMKSVVRYWDLAASSGSKNDWTVGAKMGLDLGGRFWILEIIRFRLTTFARDRRIRNTAERDGVGVRIGLEQEPASGGKSQAESTVRLLAGYVIQVDKVGESQQSKERAADAFSSQVNGGNVYVPTGVVWVKELLMEMMYFPFGRNDDQIDACSGAFNMLAKPKAYIGTLRGSPSGNRPPFINRPG